MRLLKGAIDEIKVPNTKISKVRSLKQANIARLREALKRHSPKAGVWIRKKLAQLENKPPKADAATLSSVARRQ